LRGGDEQTLQQTCSPKEAQGAFKVLMTHWFCNSHDVSHFTAFFIDMGAKTSIAESVFSLCFGLKQNTMQSNDYIASLTSA
jgi:hypothetical protein